MWLNLNDKMGVKDPIWWDLPVNSKPMEMCRTTEKSIVPLITDDIMVFNLFKLVIEFSPLAYLILAQVVSYGIDLNFKCDRLEFEIQSVFMLLGIYSETLSVYHIISSTLCWWFFLGKHSLYGFRRSQSLKSTMLCWLIHNWKLFKQSKSV